MRYVLNDGQVVSELLDGEVIAIHLESGAYYSMLASAAEIWNALIAGCPADEITDRVSRDSGGEPARIAAEIGKFIAALRAENLIVPADRPQPHAAFELHGAYAAPELQKYTDMQELLLVDPIHEVTEEGWPIRAEPGK